VAVALTPDEVGKLRQGTLLLVNRDGQLVDVTNYYAGIGFGAAMIKQPPSIEELQDTARQFQLERDEANANTEAAMQYAKDLRLALGKLVARGAGWEDDGANNGYNYCVHCMDRSEAVRKPWWELEDSDAHKANCPLRPARKLLAEGTGAQEGG
jgi:hypothetical protein